MSSIYDGQFYGNILVVGKTGCGKTTFLEELGLNNFFGDIIKTEWISGIEIDEIEVYLAKEEDERDSLIETFKLKSREETTHDNNVNNSFGENKKLNQLIVIDDASGVADVCKKFANFLTVARKFACICVYVFHVIVPGS